MTNDQADARDEIVNAARGCVDQIRSRITLDSDRLEKAVRTPEDIGAPRAVWAGRRTAREVRLAMER